MSVQHVATEQRMLDEADISARVAAALSQVQQQAAKVEFDVSAYEEAVQLLELLPPANFVDERVELAWHVCAGLGTNQRRDLWRRALCASFPVDSTIRARTWERRWLTAMGVLEVWDGNTQRALKLQMTALALSQQLGDRRGEAVEWMNLSVTAVASARYEEAMELIERAVAAIGPHDYHAEFFLIASSNRANALFRLGRLDEALTASTVALSFVEPPLGGSLLRNFVATQCMVAEILLELDRAVEARAIFRSVKRWDTRACIPELGRIVSRVGAQIKVVDGEVEAGVCELSALVSELRSSEPEALGDPLLDALHALLRVHRRLQNGPEADNCLGQIGAYYILNAKKVLEALKEAPTFTPDFRIDEKMLEIDRYLSTQRIETGLVFPSAPWDHLVSLAAAASETEDGTLQHGIRVGRLAGLLAESIGKSPEFVSAVEAAGLVHDVGKTGVLATLLRKTSALSEGEALIYDSHPAAGASLLEHADYPHKRIILNVARFHHVSYDGRNGPSSMSGDAIPIEARIVAICDAFDAAVMGRPRKPAVSVDGALNEVFQRSGRDFQPHLVDVFIDLVRRLRRDNADLMAYLEQGAEQIEYFASRRMLRRMKS